MKGTLTRITKFFENNWFLLYGIVIIIIFFFDILWGILLIVFGVLFGIFLSLLKKRGKAKLSKSLLGFDKIDERELARVSGMYIEEAHSFLHDVSRDPEASGIPILIKGQYIYFSNKVIKKFKDLYKEGKRTKELIAALPQFETKAEVGKMLAKLREFDELPSEASKEKEEAGEVAEAPDEKEISSRMGKLLMACELIGLLFALFALINFSIHDVSITDQTDAYHDWMENTTWVTGFGIISIWIAWGLYAVKRKYMMMVLLGIAIALGLSAILYVNNGRPDVLGGFTGWTGDLFNSFTSIVIWLEIGIVGSTALAILIVILKNKKR